MRRATSYPDENQAEVRGFRRILPYMGGLMSNYKQLSADNQADQSPELSFGVDKSSSLQH